MSELGPRPAPIEGAMKRRVFVESLSGANYPDLIRRGLEWIRFGDIVPSGARVFVKPNLTFPSYRPGVMTSLPAIEAALLALRDYTSHIAIGDADSGGYNRFSMDQVYRETGLLDLARRSGVEVVNLSHGERRDIRFAYRGRRFSLGLPRLLTDEVDLLVTMPVPKVHMYTGVSLSFKNQWGCIPEPADRLRLHPFLEHVILEVNKAVKARVSIMDGSFGLNVSGPMKGEPVALDWMLVADDLGAADAVACALMQIPVEQNRCLKYARAQGLLPELQEVDLNREISPLVKNRFSVRRAWTDYPGLLTFRSPFLAYLGYFSPFSKLLHRLLYLFREPFYDYERAKSRDS